MKQILRVQSTYAAPVATAALAGPSSGYGRVKSIRGVIETDNTAACRAEVVLSRSTSPLGSGSFYTEKTLERDDPLIFSQPLDALGSLVFADPAKVNAVIDPGQLMDVNGLTLGLRAVGLASDKVLSAAIEVEWDEVQASAGNLATYSAQALRFLAVGT